jgi:hypothetical protein
MGNLAMQGWRAEALRSVWFNVSEKPALFNSKCGAPLLRTCGNWYFIGEEQKFYLPSIKEEKSLCCQQLLMIKLFTASSLYLDIKKKTKSTKEWSSLNRQFRSLVVIRIVRFTTRYFSKHMQMSCVRACLYCLLIIKLLGILWDSY